MADAKKSTKREEIRKWVEQRGGKPATVKRTADHDDLGLLRIDFPGYSGEESFEPDLLGSILREV